LPFPFSDLSHSKFRPALLLGEVGRGDWIACQITSNPFADPRAVEITDADFTSGGLQRVSYVRPGKGRRKNNFREFAPGFASDSVATIERNRRRSRATVRIS